MYLQWGGCISLYIQQSESCEPVCSTQAKNTALSSRCLLVSMIRWSNGFLIVATSWICPCEVACLKLMVWFSPTLRWLFSAHGETHWIQKLAFWGIDLPKDWFVPDVKASIRGVNRMRSVSLNILKPFIFQLCSHRVEAWLQKSCALLKQVEQCCQQSLLLLFFFFLSPWSSLKHLYLHPPTPTQPHKELDFPGGSAVRNLPTNAGDTGDSGLFPGWGRSPGEGNGYPPQCSHLQNPMDRGAWWATVCGVKKSWTRLSNWAQTHATRNACDHILWQVSALPFLSYFSKQKASNDQRAV